jgi:hypothetical protein
MSFTKKYNQLIMLCFTWNDQWIWYLFLIQSTGLMFHNKSLPDGHTRTSRLNEMTRCSPFHLDVSKYCRCTELTEEAEM